MSSGWWKQGARVKEKSPTGSGMWRSSEYGWSVRLRSSRKWTESEKKNELKTEPGATQHGVVREKRKEPAAESETIGVIEENQESRMSWPSGEESTSTGRRTAVGPVLCQVRRKEGWGRTIRFSMWGTSEGVCTGRAVSTHGDECLVGTQGKWSLKMQDCEY